MIHESASLISHRPINAAGILPQSNILIVLHDPPRISLRMAQEIKTVANRSITNPIDRITTSQNLAMTSHNLDSFIVFNPYNTERVHEPPVRPQALLIGLDALVMRGLLPPDYQEPAAQAAGEAHRPVDYNGSGDLSCYHA
jgi:hypothetical protein